MGWAACRSSQGGRALGGQRPEVQRRVGTLCRQPRQTEEAVPLPSAVLRSQDLPKKAGRLWFGQGHHQSPCSAAPWGGSQRLWRG
eukprot:3099421-Pyramimonas_sp.AAC.1